MYDKIYSIRCRLYLKYILWQHRTKGAGINVCDVVMLNIIPFRFLHFYFPFLTSAPSSSSYISPCLFLACSNALSFLTPSSTPLQPSSAPSPSYLPHFTPFSTSPQHKLHKLIYGHQSNTSMAKLINRDTKHPYIRVREAINDKKLNNTRWFQFTRNKLGKVSQEKEDNDSTRSIMGFLKTTS